MTDSENSSERCVLCLDQKRSPVRIQCGHSFCCDCLDVYKSYNKYAWANKCPICRNELQEKKRAPKRKYNELHSSLQNSTITSSDETQRSSDEESSHLLILEEFMALAAGYDDIGMDRDNYDSLDETLQDLAEDDDSSFQLDFETDSSGVYYDDDNYEIDNNYDNIENIDNFYQPPRTRRHHDGLYREIVHDYSGEDGATSSLDVADYVPYQLRSSTPRDWNDNFNSTLDLELVIPSEIIIID